MCGACAGQTGPGKDLDVKRCTRCKATYPWFIPWAKPYPTCQLQCNAGQYESKAAVSVASAATQGECGKCKAPCRTCRNCVFPADKSCAPVCTGKAGEDKSKCVADASLAGADFCLSCDRTAFHPANVTDVDSIEHFVYLERSMVARKQDPLTAAQTKYITDNYNAATSKEFSMKNFMRRKVFLLPDGKMGTAPDAKTGLVTPPAALKVKITKETTYRELYEALHKDYPFPRQSLHENKCLKFCPAGFTDINGFCRPCTAPCATCAGGRERCLTCLQDVSRNPEKKFYAFGRACVAECPPQTVTDEVNKRCLGCASGCEVCDVKDTNKCYKCTRNPNLLLFNHTCVAQCPEGYRENFFRTACDLATEVPVIYFPFMILTALVFLIAWMGKKSSKNISGQHRVLLSFYSLAGLIDVVAIWALLILMLAQGT